MNIYSENKTSSLQFPRAPVSAGENSFRGGIYLSDLTPPRDAMTVRCRKGKRCGGKSSYRHVPHSQKPPHLVAKRNARERRRVEAVNNAFQKLRKHVHCETKQKRLSKVKTLRVAIEYIRKLQNMIIENDRKLEGRKLEQRKSVRQSLQTQNTNYGYTPTKDRPGVQYGVTCQSAGYNWKNYSEVSREIPANNFTGHVNSLPEYGSLGMNEISSLPDL